MKLHEIKVNTTERFVKLKHGGLWVNCNPYSADFITDDGTYKLRLGAGWLTDYRSGSSIVDCIVPKKGNAEYNATIFLHDCAYSGWLSRGLADDFLKQGMVMSGLSEFRATMAYKAVRALGASAYYDLDIPLRGMYKENRNYESLTLEAK